MSLETLLEAAEFLEWNKPGKKSRATRTSKKAEKSKPSTNTERKRKAPPSRPVVTDDVQPDDIPPDDEDAPVASSSMDGTAPLTFSDAVAVLADDLIPEDSEDDEDKIIMRDLRRSIGSRETHNKLEKNRRAHLKECFELLRCELPSSDERKSSNLSTLRSALRLIEHLNNKQKELESERRRMTKLKNSKLAQINSLKKELSDKGIDYNIDDWIEVHHTSTNSTNTASECGDPTPENLPKEAVGPKPKLTVHTASPSEVKLMLQGEPKLGIIAPVSGKTKSNVVQAALNVEPQAPASPSQVVKVTKLSRGTAVPARNIFLTPKVMSNTAVLNKSTQPQVCTAAAIDSGQLYISTIPSQTPNVIAPNLQQASLADAVPLTVNPAPRIVRPLHQQIPANLSIAPKQLLLITAGNEAGIGTAQPLTPSTITVPVIEHAAPQVLPVSNATHMIPIGSLANTPHASLQNIQPLGGTATRPAIIHGVLPSKKSDGTVSYLPIKISKPPAVTAMSPLPVVTTFNSTRFAGRGVTIVIPPATAVANSPHTVQLTTTTHALQFASAPHSVQLVANTTPSTH